MSNHLNQKGSRRIGIIGGGVSGLSAAYFLDESARLDVTLHERLDRLGGNALTVDAKTPEGKPFAVDPVAYLFVTDRYPYFTTWLKQLGVKTLPLSFENYLWNGFTQTGTLITSNLKKVFFYPGRSLRYFRNLFLFKKLIQTINKLEKQGRIHDRMLLGEFMALVPGMDDVFKLEVFYPLMSFAFHTDFDTLDDKPCAAILRSYACAGNNPGGLYCVDGGIRQYIQKVHQALGKTQVIMNSSVVAVRKSDQPVSAWEVTTADGTTHLYDEVIMALWPNQAAELLRKGFEQGKPDEELQKMEEVLAKVELAYCRATVHNDVSSMPEDKRNWANYCYTLIPGLNYVMGTIWSGQALKEAVFTSYDWSLKANGVSDKETRIQVQGPVYEVNFHFRTPPRMALLDAQEYVASRQGHNGLWFTGCFLRENGFHEDGLAVTVGLMKDLAPDYTELKRLQRLIEESPESYS